MFSYELGHYVRSISTGFRGMVVERTRKERLMKNGAGGYGTEQSDLYRVDPNPCDLFSDRQNFYSHDLIPVHTDPISGKPIY